MAALQTPFFTRNKHTRWSRCVFVDSEDALQQLERVLQAHSLIALDTESNNLYSYAPRVCLVQCAVQSRAAGATADSRLIFLLDPDRVNLRRLKPIFENPDKKFILHAATNDLGHLWKEFQIRLANVFDTQVAARLVGMKRTTLGTLLAEHFDVEQSKNFQTSDWGRRPLTQKQIQYACEDVIYLISLYRHFLQALRECNRWHEGLAIMEEIAQRDYSRFGSPAKTFWDHQATKRVPIHLMNVYQSLWRWREAAARQADCPRFKILGDKPLLILTREQPADWAALRRCQCLTSDQIRAYGQSLLEAIRTGRKTNAPARPRRHAGAQALSKAERRQDDLFQALRKWRADTSQNRGVDSELVLSKYALQVIAEDAPTTMDALAKRQVLSTWKLQEYGQELIRVVKAMVLPQ